MATMKAAVRLCGWLPCVHYTSRHNGLETPKVDLGWNRTAKQQRQLAIELYQWRFYDCVPSMALS